MGDTTSLSVCGEWHQYPKKYSDFHWICPTGSICVSVCLFVCLHYWVQFFLQGLKKYEKISLPLSFFFSSSVERFSVSRMGDWFHVKGPRKKVNVKKWIFLWWNVKDNKKNWWFGPFFLTTFVFFGCFSKQSKIPKIKSENVKKKNK